MKLELERHSQPGNYQPLAGEPINRFMRSPEIEPDMPVLTIFFDFDDDKVDVIAAHVDYPEPY